MRKEVKEISNVPISIEIQFLDVSEFYFKQKAR